MRLKTLEIKGFKSFADKTVLHFDKGVTGVIGPNGCGKSNIIDSIRWAIGEHKTSALRSERMSGLIFNGSKARASSGLAEVSLTFENTKNILPTEFGTVTINRRYFKNGDSEFRLNDVACRLKDINNLFLDTGVSTDTYAIIELGMVDDIIKDKDQSRRRMLEQAAGISIYKTRKKEAQNKLKSTEQDLDRIEDLLFEIQGNMKTLERQARKAERYYKLKKKYKATSVELAKASMEGFHETFKQLTELQKSQEDRKAKINAGISQSDAKVEELKLSLAEEEKALQTMQRAYNELVDKIRNKENEQKLAEQRLSYSRNQKKQIEDFLSGTDEKLKDLRANLDKKQEEYTAQSGKLEKLKEGLGELEAKKKQAGAVYEEKRTHREKQRKEQQVLQQHQFDLEKKVAVGETSIQNLQQSIDRIEKENKNRHAVIEEQESLAKELKEEVEKKEQVLKERMDRFEKTKEKILNAQEDVEDLRAELAEKNRALDAKKNEYDLLKSMVDNLEGYPDSMKFLKKNAGWEKEVPVLSDIISVDKAYRPAIEGLLEPYLNYYVVDKLEDAIRAIELLEKNKKGKANFFLLDKFEEEKESTLLKEDKLKAAIDLIEVDGKYSGLAHYLLGKVYLTDSLDGLETLLKKNPDITIVEKSGKLRRSYNRLGGGSVGLFEGNKLGRAKSLKKLKMLIDKLQKEAGQLSEKMKEKQQALTGYNESLNGKELEATKEEINRLKNQSFGIRNKIENLISLTESDGGRLKEFQARLTKTREEIAGFEKEKSTFSEKKERLLQEMEKAEEIYLEADRAYNEINSKYNEQNLQYTRHQSLVGSIRQDETYLQRRLSELEEQINTNQMQLEGVVKEIEKEKEVWSKSGEAVKEWSFKREEKQKELNEKDQEYNKIKNTVGELEKNLRLLQKDRSDVEEELSRLKEKVNELKLQLAGMKERLDVEFGIDLDEILDEDREGEESEEALRTSVENYKNRLNNMGEINPTAIDAFQEIKKRYDFITEQKEDLVKARNSLEDTIREVENTANEKFMNTFHKVKENFIKVFKTLFTEEDEADLFLSDPEDPSETGIEIVAKPKGKRPAAITQLSGGEKTLTAIALLFAIYLIKPAPFCILDEVDAPLDDVNIEKFTHMIREFSENSQFIVITHNKQTMAAVDVIYGVTMQEAGVSKLVPVDFRSLN